MVNPSKKNKNAVILTAELSIAQWQNLMIAYPNVISELMTVKELGDEARAGIAIISDVMKQFVPGEKLLKKIAT